MTQVIRSFTITKASHDYDAVSFAIDTQCVGQIPDTAYAILRMILNRTLGIGRRDNSVTYDEIADGVYIDGRCVQRGLGISRATISKYVKLLVDTGLLEVSFRRSEQNGFCFSVYRIRTEAIGGDMAILKEPRKPRLQTFSKLKTSKKDMTFVSSKVELSDTYINVVNKGVNTSSLKTTEPPSRRSRLRSFSSVSEAVGAVTKTAPRRAPVAQFFDDKGRLKKAPFLRVFDRTVREHYPDAVLTGCTDKEFYAFAAQAKTVLQTISIYDLVDYVASQWVHIIRNIHASNKSWAPSIIPSIRSLSMHWRTVGPSLQEFYSQDAINARLLAQERGKVAERQASSLASQVDTLKSTLEATQARLKDVESVKDKEAGEARRKRLRGANPAVRAVEDLPEVDDDTIPEWR